MTKPSEGRIEVFGIDALTDPDRVRQNIGYVPQSLSFVMHQHKNFKYEKLNRSVY